MALLDRRLLVTTGKGGVGKSTVTAALALHAAARGKRVLVCEVNTKERISALLGARPVGEEIGRLADNIDAVVVRPHEALREYALMQLKYRAIYTAVFENRWVARFLRFIPSLPEVVMLGKVLFHVKERRWDLVLLDAPATGHGITLLRVPQAVIDTVPPGAMRDDATWMRDLLVDPEVTAVNLVSLPEELPVNETLELAAATRDVLHMQLGGIFLNRHEARRFSAEECARLEGAHADARLDAAAGAARAQAARAELSARYEARLRDELGRPVLPIPVLPPQGDFGRPDVDRVADAFARAGLS